MATVLSRRLGKRSLLGARISAPPLLGEGVLVPTQNHPLHPDHHDKGSPPLVSYEEHGDGPADQHQNWPALLPGQKVCVFCNGQEKTGLVEHHDRDSNEVKISLPEQGFSVCRKAEEVRLADVQTLPCLPLEMEHSSGMTVGFDAIPVAMEDCPATTADAVASALRSVSQNIDVPKRKSDAAVEMDEMMAAMVLTSLSCSPVVQSPPNSDASIPAARMEVAKNWKTGKLFLAD